MKQTDRLLAVLNAPANNESSEVMAEIAGDWFATFSENPDLMAQLIAELCNVNPKALAQALLNLKYLG